MARRYLYFAALRWIARDPQAREWYRRKVERNEGLKGKAIIALMRQLTRALWHVGRGGHFDASRLFHSEAAAMAA